MIRKILFTTLALPVLLLSGGPAAANSAKSGDGNLAPLSVGQPTIDRLLHLCDSLYTIGFSFASKGYSRIADWYIGQSVAAISSLRGAIGDIYLDKKKALEDEELEADNELVKEELGFDLSGLLAFAEALQGFADELGDTVDDLMPGMDFDRAKTMWWPVRESINLVSPYGPLFHALVLDYRGEIEEAAQHYATALLNPFLDPQLMDFCFLVDLEAEELLALSRTLSGRENEYRNAFHGDGFFFDLSSPIPWSAEYHRAMAMEALDGEHPNYYLALRYCEAALHVDPFDIVNYENIARICVMAGNFHDLGTYVMEGIAIDPDNAFFREAVEIYDKYQDK